MSGRNSASLVFLFLTDEAKFSQQQYTEQQRLVYFNQIHIFKDNRLLSALIMLVRDRFPSLLAQPQRNTHERVFSERLH
jgi:hypothetical protein